MRIFYTTVFVLYKYSPLEQLAAIADGDDAVDPETEIEVEVEVEYNPGWYTPGRTSGDPDDCYPPDGEDPEILSVKDASGRDLLDLISREQYSRLVHAADKDQKEAERDERIEAAERAAEARRESRFDDWRYGDYGDF